MIKSAAELYNFQPFVRVSRAFGVAYVDRDSRISCGVVAKLAVAVVSPGVGVSVVAQGQRMLASAADL